MAGEIDLDELDLRLLHELQQDCRTPLHELAKKVGHPTSTVHYRIKRLERAGIIEGYYAKLNSEKIGMDYITVIRIDAKYGPEYYATIGKQLAEIDGVWAVYYSLGEQDFFALTRSKDRAEFMGTLSAIMNVDGVQRTKTQVVAEVIKEDPRIDVCTKIRRRARKRKPAGDRD